MLWKVVLLKCRILQMTDPDEGERGMLERIDPVQN